ncbi:hypothetical protein [Nocardioides stalactiti]|uniref:hypothetical protein n=1 Tax=Nocardioides stalactiti TaxID=2755356 RepID=UPI001C816E2D|nr:hypothetical protein [Nocardioides stalactiti]
MASMDDPAEFDDLLRHVTADTSGFGHREHVQLTWLAVRRFGLADAIDLVCSGIRRTARYAGAPQKYHATMSRAWIELVGHHASEEGDPDFTTFLDRNPALLDKRLLLRFYSPGTLSGAEARTGWVLPDRARFPWVAQQGGV